MSLVSKIKEKARHVEAPSLEIDAEDVAKLESGEVVIVSDKETGSQFFVRVKVDKLGQSPITPEDLFIEKVPSVAAKHDASP